MTDSSLRVAPLMKVTLRVSLSVDGDSPARSLEPKTMKFIYGISKEGLTPFESALYDKAPGDRLTLSADVDELFSLMGHLYPLLPNRPECRKRLCRVDIEVTDIAQPDSREVIKAMADLVEGCGGECGCGCGCGC